ncbi:uncharacterized protein BDV14DRAFT_78386 [Aspergillus stella-maris]|uniref:uncharacterized protein n=1 Tax=Aspergillus stella-maris TaxID=1810926 RepID=UPI003CCD6111
MSQQQQQQQTVTSPGPPRFYQHFKKPHESSTPAPAPSPIVTLSDFSFNPRPSFTSTRSETIDASIARPQTLLHPSFPSSNSTTPAGSSHTRNLSLPFSHPKTRSEPSQPRPQLSLILPSDASTLGLPTSTCQGTAASSSHLRSASYTAGQSATQQITDGPIDRSPTPYARPKLPGLPTTDPNSRSRYRSRSSSITNSTISNDRPQGQTSPRKPPPIPPRPRRSVANNNQLMQEPAPQLINNLPDPLRSHPLSPLSPDQTRSRSYSQPIEPPPRPPKIPYRNSDPYTRGQGRPPIPAGLSPESTPITPSQPPGNKGPEQPQRHDRSYSSGSVGEAVPKTVSRRPVNRNAASEPVPTTSNDALSPTLGESSASARAPVQAAQVLTSATPSSPPLQQIQVTSETTESSRRRSSPLSNVSTPPSRDSTVSACTSTRAETRQSSGSTSSDTSTSVDTNMPLPSMPTSLPTSMQEASISELSLSERIRQPRLSLNSLRSLSLLARSSKSDLHSYSHSQSQIQSLYQSPLPSPSPLSFGSPDSRSPSTAANSTSSSSQHSKTRSQRESRSQNQSQNQNRSTMNSPTPPQPQSHPQPQPRISTTSSSTAPQVTTSTNPSTPLLTLTTHIQTQLSLAVHLFTTFSPVLSWTERTWMQGTISDTERAISAVHFLTESLRVEEEINAGKIGLGSRMRWKLRDGRKAKERREDLVLVSGSLGRVIARLQGIQGNFPHGPGASTGQGQSGIEANDIAIIAEAASKELTPAATSLSVSKSIPRLPTTNILEAGAGSTTPPAPESAGKPPSPPWDLTIQRQDAGMELFVDGGILDSQSVNSSMVQFAICDTEAGSTGTTVHANGDPNAGVSPNSPPPPAVSPPPPPPPSTKLDEELLDLLNWRWNRGRVNVTQ